MTKLLTTLVALALLPGAAFAGNHGGNRNQDLRDSDTYRGKYSQYYVAQTSDEAALAIIEPSHADREHRRLDEKNNGGGNR
jgi:hypothetical protein